MEVENFGTGASEADADAAGNKPSAPTNTMLTIHFTAQSLTARAASSKRAFFVVTLTPPR